VGGGAFDVVQQVVGYYNFFPRLHFRHHIVCIHLEESKEDSNCATFHHPENMMHLTVSKQKQNVLRPKRTHCASPLLITSLRAITVL